MSVLNESYFHDEPEAFKRLEALLWPDGPVCPHCGATDRIYALEGVRSKKTKKNPEGVIRHGLRKCGHCLKQFTVRVGTIFEDSHAPLHKWFQAIHLMCASKKGVSAHQLHRMLQVQYKTAWFMAHRIREAMRSGPLSPLGGDGGIVEIDETVYGRAATHPKGRQKFKASMHKNIILALVERGGEVRSWHVSGATVSEVVPIVNENVAKEASVMTDASSVYKKRLGDFARHDIVDHTKDEYVRHEEGRPAVHTNTVENFFGVFKRGMRGTYQPQREAPAQVSGRVRFSLQQPLASGR
jgi:transposase-like protein